MVYPKTREKIQTRIFGLGSGQVSLNKISGFSGLTSENPKNSGRVSDFSGFLDTLVLRSFFSTFYEQKFIPLSSKLKY